MSCRPGARPDSLDAEPPRHCRRPRRLRTRVHESESAHSSPVLTTQSHTSRDERRGGSGAPRGSRKPLELLGFERQGAVPSRGVRARRVPMVCPQMVGYFGMLSGVRMGRAGNPGRRVAPEHGQVRVEGRYKARAYSTLAFDLHDEVGHTPFDQLVDHGLGVILTFFSLGYRHPLLPREVAGIGMRANPARGQLC